MNSLLASLGPRVLPQVLSVCERVELSFGQVLWEPGQRVRQVYFPIEGFISQLIPIDDHENLEIGLVGNEGMIGLPLLLDVKFSLLQSLVQGEGTAQRIESADFLQVLERLPGLRHLLNRYAYVSMSQLGISASCNSFHTLDARLARWLLQTHDKSNGDSFRITQKFLAQMLGVRRVGVTNAAGLLRKRRLISYHRGDITILDRAGLEAAACGCYQRSIDAYAKIIG